MSGFKHDKLHILHDHTRPLSRPHTSHPFQHIHNITQSNLFLGIPPPEHKPENTYRLFCVNPNRITMTTTHNDFNKMCYTLNSYSIDTACIHEHNLETHKHTIKQQIYQTCNRQYHHSKVSMAITSIPSMTNFKPGGDHDVLPRTSHSSHHPTTHRPVWQMVLPNIQL